MAKKTWLGGTLAMLAIGGLGGLVGGFAAKHAGDLAFLKPLAALLDHAGGWPLLALPLLWLLAVAVHEAGHLAAGMARGMRFLMVVVGGLGLVRSGGRVQGRLYFNLGALGGFVVAQPDPARPLRPQMLWLVAGGPLASLGLAAVAGVVALSLPAGVVAAWWLVLALISLLLFFATAVPMRAGGFLSDGLQWWKLRGDAAFLARRAHLIALMGPPLAGTRPRDFDAAQLARAQAVMGDEAVYDVGVALYAYLHAFDRGDIATAARWLQRIAAKFDEYPDGFRQGLAIEGALFEATQGELDAAESWLAKARGGVVDASRRALAEAAVAQRRGDATRARMQLDLVDKTLSRAMDPGTARLTADLARALRDRLGATPSAPATA